jgi:DivIVA domain-containing protein
VAYEQSRLNTLDPAEVTNHGLPVAMRGYDKDRVDRHLARVADAYVLVLRRYTAQQDRLRSLEDELDAAVGEARASAKSVAELMQRSPTTKGQPAQTREPPDELEARLERSETGREQALADLREASERASDLGRRLEAFEDEQRQREQAVAEVAQPAVADGEAATLLVVAARAAEDVRNASRERALRTLTKARERAMQFQVEADRERAALVEMQDRRTQLEREANEILAQARDGMERERAALAEMEERREQLEREAHETLAQARADADRERAALAEMEERREQLGHEADEILAQARADADRVVAAIEEERQRVRELLTGALTSLDVEAKAHPEGLVGDLSSRLQESTELNVT